MTEFEEGISDCCGAEVIWTDVCNKCGEHCEVIKEEVEEDEREK